MYSYRSAPLWEFTSSAGQREADFLPSLRKKQRRVTRWFTRSYVYSSYPLYPLYIKKKNGSWLLVCVCVCSSTSLCYIQILQKMPWGEAISANSRGWLAGHYCEWRLAITSGGLAQTFLQVRNKSTKQQDEMRSSCESDFLLLLLTKWGRKCSPATSKCYTVRVCASAQAPLDGAFHKQNVQGKRQVHVDQWIKPTFWVPPGPGQNQQRLFCEEDQASKSREVNWLRGRMKEDSTYSRAALSKKKKKNNKKRNAN